MSTYVLIHGAWNGGWCWDKVVTLLKQAGHKAIVLDLPGRAGDTTPLKEITLDSYVKKVCNIINFQDEEVILVGHSMGGITVTHAAEKCSDNLKALVYISGYLLQNGQSIWDVTKIDKQGLVWPNAYANQEEGFLEIKKDAPVKNMFYGDCSDEDFERAKAMLVVEPLNPFVTPTSTTIENFGRIPRIYIECLLDKAITPFLQKEMYTALPCRKVISMNTSHSPFDSAPDELVEHLISLS